MKLIFILFIYSLTIHAQLSDDTVKYFKNDLKASCLLDANDSILVDFIFNSLTAFKDQTQLRELSLKSLDKFLMLKQCDSKILNSFYDKYNLDMDKIYKKELKEIAKEIINFQKAGLIPSAKYIEYKHIAEKIRTELNPSEKFYLTQVANIEKIQASRKNSCSDVMNLKEPLSINKPRAQGNSRWCFAYTASDLVANETGILLSAFDLGVQNNEGFFHKLFRLEGGGFIGDIIKDAKKNGACLESDLPSDDSFFMQDFKLHVKDLYVLINELGTKYRNRETPKELLMILLCRMENSKLNILNQMFPKMNLTQIVDILQTMGNSTLFENIAKNQCRKNQDNKIKNLKTNLDLIGGNDFSKIDAILNKGKIMGAYIKSDSLLDYKKNGEVDHAVSIVGRRFNNQTQSCEYMIRNSWGNSCLEYDPNYECQNGHVWISEEYLKYNKAISSVIYIE